MNRTGQESLGFVLFASAVTAIGGFLFGYDTAVINGANTFLQQHFRLDPSRDAFLVGLATSAAIIGCIPGAMSAGFVEETAGNAPRNIRLVPAHFVGRVGAIQYGMDGERARPAGRSRHGQHDGPMVRGDFRGHHVKSAVEGVVSGGGSRNWVHWLGEFDRDLVGSPVGGYSE